MMSVVISIICALILAVFIFVVLWKLLPYAATSALVVILWPVWAVKGLFAAFRKESPNYRWRKLILACAVVTCLSSIGLIVIACLPS